MNNAEKKQENFATRLRKLRQEKDIKQEILISKLGISTQTLSKWENGHSEPRLSHLIKLAETFDVSLDYLVGMSDNRHSNADNEITEFKERIEELFQQQQDNFDMLSLQQTEHSNTSTNAKLVSRFGLAALTKEEFYKFLHLDI